jgi:hypothetical protein
VVVVLTTREGRLEARRAAAEVDAVDETALGQLVERAIDARDTDAIPLGAQSIEELLRGDAAVLRGEVADDCVARPTRPRTAAAQAVVSVLAPGRCPRHR